MTPEEMWKAVVNCDASYDGLFFYGVKSTRIYCRPSCKSKTPKRENVVFFETKEEAEKAGFRPCKRCRPDLLAYHPAADLSERAKKMIERDYADHRKLLSDMKDIGVSRKHLSELFTKEYGFTPSDYRMQLRIKAAKKLLREGKSVTDTSLLSGYANPSEFQDHFRRETGLPPARYRQIFARDISRSVFDSPIGKLRIYASSSAILRVDQEEKERKEIGEGPDDLLEDHLSENDGSEELVNACRSELEEYFIGKRKTFDLPLLPEGTEFQKRVYAELRKIPYGETRTYGELAASAGNAKASRAVGMANHNNPILILIPCHRVIGADGSLTGYAAGLEAKKFLLNLEKEHAF